MEHAWVVLWYDELDGGGHPLAVATDQEKARELLHRWVRESNRHTDHRVRRTAREGRRLPEYERRRWEPDPEQPDRFGHMVEPGPVRYYHDQVGIEQVPVNELLP